MANYVSNLTVQVGDNSSATYNIRELFPHVGTCSTAAATAAKEVTIGNFKLYTGAWVVVKFNNTNSAAVASLTLNVDGTGAKPIKYRNANLGWAGQLISNRYTYFIYDGTNYQIVSDFNSDTYDRTSHQTRIYAGTIGVFNYSLCAMDNNQRMQSFTTTSGTGTAKTFNTSASFMYPPVIMYNAANSTYADGTAIANNVLYEQYPSVDLRYSCNVTSTAGFTQYKPVYLECTINSDGTFKLTTTGLTQTFTNGKYYILLGCMYNTSIYQLALFAQHPMFYYDGTHLNGIVYTAAEKTKLSGIANGATKVESSSNGKIKINGTDTTVYSHPTHTAKTSGLYKITVDSTGHVSGTASVAKGDIPALDYSKVSISRSLTSGTKIGTITIDGTATDLYCQTNTNTDTLVSQTFASADHNRPLLMSYYDTGVTTTTAQIVHRNDALFFNPSSGILRSPRLYLQTTGMPITINLDTLKPSAGENVNVLSVRYKNTDGTATHTVFPIGILGNDATGSSATVNSGVRLGSTNGTTIVGAGESSTTFAAAQAKYNDESLYLVADQAVYMYTNCSNDATTVTGPWRVGGFTTGTAAITSGRVMITDGTTGGFKASDYTIAKSVPSDAKFSDTVTTVTTSGSGNAVTSITASNGALTVTKGSTFSLSTHTHGLLHSDLTQDAPNGTTGGWSVIGIDPAVKGYVLKSIRINETSPNWLSGDYGAGIAFGGSDTKGVISMKYQSPVITFAGGNHKSTITSPKWYFKISGTSGSTYNLDSYLPLSGGTMTGAIAYNNATTRLNSLKNLTNESVGTSATYFLTITNSWGKGGYTSVADAKTVLGLGSAAYTASTAYLASTTKYAGSSSAGGAATSANILNKNNTAGATTAGVQYANGQLTVGTADGNAVEGSNASYKLWSYPAGGTAVGGGTANIQNLRLYWSSIYFRDIFISPNNYDIYHRSVAAGTAQPWRKILDSGNYTSYALPRNIKHIHTASGTEGSVGWVKIARITVTANHPNHPMTFTIAQRGVMQYRIHLVLENYSVASAAISKFIIARDNSWTDTNNNPRAYIIKPSDGIFDLYIRKTEGYDHIFVVDFTKADDSEGNNYSVTWTNVHAADSAITGGTEAVKKLYLLTTTNYAGSSSAGGAATSANKLNTNAGGTYLPVYFSSGVPVAVTVKNNTSLGTIGWTSGAASNAALVTVNSIAYWNGTYSGTSSNLTYCNRGAFGTIVTKSTTDYSKVSISRNLTSGTKVGTITIDGTATDLYCQTNTNTTYTFATGDSNGQIKVTPSSGSAYNVAVKGLASAAYVTQESLLRARSTVSTDGGATGWSQIGINQYNNAFPDGVTNKIYGWGAVISMPAPNARFDLYYNHNSSTAGAATNGLQYRTGWDNDKKAWRMLLDSGNYTSYTVTKTGSGASGTWGISITGNVNGKLYHTGTGSSWWNDRDGAVIRITTGDTQYRPLWTLLTATSGSWGMGNHTGDDLTFNFISKAVYDSKKNPSTNAQIKFTNTGGITATGTITANKFYGDITGDGLNAGIYDLLNTDNPIFNGAEWMLTSIPSSPGGTSTPSFRRVKTAKFADYVNSVSRNVLFNDSTNTSKSITLSTPPTDTQYLKLYFKSSGNSGQPTVDNSVYSIAEVPYMTDVNLGGILQVAQPSDNMGILKLTALAFTIRITNKTLTLIKASYPSRLDGSTVANDTHLSANIIKVVAYR